MFTQEDLAKYKAFKTVLEQGNFDIKGNATIAVASLFVWYNSLEKRIIEDVTKQTQELKLEEVKQPIKKLGK